MNTPPSQTKAFQFTSQSVWRRHRKKQALPSRLLSDRSISVDILRTTQTFTSGNHEKNQSQHINGDKKQHHRLTPATCLPPANACGTKARTSPRNKRKSSRYVQVFLSTKIHLTTIHAYILRCRVTAFFSS